MKKLLIVLALFTLNLSAQKPAFNKQAYDSLVDQLYQPKKGVGNNTFVLNVAKLEKLFGSKPQSLEAQLGEWSYGKDNALVSTYDDKTDTKLSGYRISYDGESKTKKLYITADVYPENLNGTITKFSIITAINGTQLADLKVALSATGYRINQNLSSMLHKECWEHKSKKYTFTFKRNPVGNYTIEGF